jgi:integrase
VLDTYSRRVVGWSIDASPTAALVTNALGMAIDSRLGQRTEPGTVIHSDQGVQFGSWAFTKRAKDSGLLASMGSIGDCYDNSMIEAFWSRMQVELLDRQKWNTRLELANAIFEYLDLAQPQAPPQPARMAHADRVRTQPHHHRGMRIQRISITRKPGHTRAPGHAGAIHTATWSSARWGELVALTRDRLDLLHGTMRIDRQLVELRNCRLQPDRPKSDAGVRTIHLPPHLIPELEHHLAHYVPSDCLYVFPNSKGEPIKRSSFRSVWLLARSKAGLPNLRFHDLRHTGNTLAAATGASTRD